MNPEQTNLLPHARGISFRQNYFIRLGVVVIIVGAVLLAIHAVLLLPSYLYLKQQVSLENLQLTHLNTQLAQSGQQTVQGRLSRLQSEASYLSGLDKKPTASTALRAVLAVPHSGISLTGFTYTAPANGSMASMQVMGFASTRETLRNYVQSLGTLHFVSSADLPISAYAQESNISFTITLTGSLQP